MSQSSRFHIIIRFYVHLLVIIGIALSIMPQTVHATTDQASPKPPPTPASPANTAAAPLTINTGAVPIIVSPPINPCILLPAKCAENYVTYGQSTVGTLRKVVLNWSNTAATAGTFKIYRKNITVANNNPDILIATVQAANYSSFTANVSQTSKDTLTKIFNNNDLSAIFTILTNSSTNWKPTNPTERRNATLTRMVIQRFPDVANVLGFGYTDVISSDELTATFRYRVKKYTVASGEADIADDPYYVDSVKPDTPAINLPTPTNLAEANVYDPPATDTTKEVGKINATRSAFVVERYDPTIMQGEYYNDQKVFLKWSEESSGLTPSNRIVKGYNVYRRPTTCAILCLISWTKLNNDPVTFSSSQPITNTGIISGTVSSKPYSDDPYNFVDKFNIVANPYISWKYKVCPVDLAGTEGTCSATVDAFKRDLIPPTQVSTLTAKEIYPNPTKCLTDPAYCGSAKIKLQWTYKGDTNTSGFGDPPKFYVTRAITTGQALATWIDVGIPIVSTNLIGNTSVVTYTTYDTPSLSILGQTQWYRVQVRDNAGNWSAPSNPVKGAIFNRTPPAKPVLDVGKNACAQVLPSRMAVPAGVTQVLLWRKVTALGDWRLVKRFRTNTNGGLPRGINLRDTYIPPQTNSRISYKIEYVDANGNISQPLEICIRGPSPNDLLPPRFTINVSKTDQNAPANAVIDFGGTTDVYSRSVVIAGPDPIRTSTIVTATVPGANSTFNFPIYAGESLRVGAFSSALTETTDISSTLNTVWVRNVNNFLNLDITTTPGDLFLDAPRNMANLGTINVTWAGANTDFCRETPVNSPPRKVCVYLDAKTYVGTETPPAVAVFRRIDPSTSGLLATNIPWIQVTPVTSWTKSGSNWYINDTTVMDPKRTYEYMAIAHSGTSYEVIGYFTSVKLNPFPYTDMPNFVELGIKTNTSSWTQAYPATCGGGTTTTAIPVTIGNSATLPPALFTKNNTLNNVISLGNGWTYTVENIIGATPKSTCTIGATTVNTNLYMSGTLKANNRTVQSNLVIYNANLTPSSSDLVGPTFASTKISAKFPNAAISQISSTLTNGLQVKLRDINFQISSVGSIASTTAMTVTLPTHIRIGVDTTDPVYSYKRAQNVVMYTNNFDGRFTTSTFYGAVTSNTTYTSAVVSGATNVVVIDEFSPWFYRTGGVATLPSDASALTFDTIEATSRFTYNAPVGLTVIPDNNAGFAGAWNTTRDYRYTSGTFAINKTGITTKLDYSNQISYVTAYPASFQIKATGGATIKVIDSLIFDGSLKNASVKLNYYGKDSDTTYAKTASGKALLVKANFLPIEKGLKFIAPFTDIQTVNMTPVSNTLSIGSNGIITTPVTTTDTIRFPGFNFTPNLTTLRMAFYAAPAMPLGMSSFGSNLPKPVQSAWEQINRGLADQSDLDPGLNFNGKNSINYASYGSGVFDTRMDAYLRVGGYSEHLIFENLGATAKNNLTGYNETLTKFSAIFVDNLIVDPSDIRSQLVLPYPSDVTVPLNIKTFSADGVPLGGTIGTVGGASLTHKYWNFTQTAKTWGYATGKTLTRYVNLYLKTNYPGVASYTPTQTTAAKNALPKMIFQIGGDMQPLAARSAASTAANVPGVSEWMPNGDYGTITLSAPSEVYVSGLPFTPNDIKLNRYYDKFMDKTSYPSTLGITKVNGLPSKILDTNKNFTAQSMHDCVVNNGPNAIACGIQILDGNNSFAYFGEPTKCQNTMFTPSPSDPTKPTDTRNGCLDASGAPTSIASTRAGGSDPDAPTGDGTIATAGDDTTQGDTLWNPIIVQWVWDVGSNMIDLPIPLVFIANKSGGVLTGMLVNQSILPGPAELFKSDISIIINGRLISGVFNTDIGIFFGFSASQAAFRALASHRPNSNNTGFKAFGSWNDVKDDVKKWYKTFYRQDYDGINNSNDAVDLAQDIWEGYDPGNGKISWEILRTSQTPNRDAGNDYLNTSFLLEPKLKAAKANELYSGVTPLKQGTVLQKTCATLSNGQGSANISIVGSNVSLTLLNFSSYIDVKRSTGSSCSSDGALFHADRVSLSLNNDGEIVIIATNIQSDIISKDTSIDIQLVIGTAAGSRRIEGGFTIHRIDIAAVSFNEIGAVFGIGEYTGTTIAYIGVTGSGTFKGYTVGVQFLVGTFRTNSPVLQAQYSGLLSKLGSDRGTGNFWTGVYLSASAEIPWYDIGCLLNVTIVGEIRGWYLKNATIAGNEAWGGYLSAGAYAEAVCLVSARGQVSLSIAYTTNDGTIYNGNAWIAGGIGWCSPSTWKSWESRWWDDSWCETAGAYLSITYSERTDHWSIEYETDIE